MAYGFYGMPRATGDVDFNIFLPADANALAETFSALREFGIEFDENDLLQQAAKRGDFRAYYNNIRLDFFVMSVPLSESAATRVRSLPFLGRPIAVLAPEDLILFKLLFFRSRDELDIRRMVATLGKGLDREYVLRWLLDLVGDQDARTAFWKKTLAELG